MSCPQTWSTIPLSNSEGLTMSLSLYRAVVDYGTVKFRESNMSCPQTWRTIPLSNSEVLTMPMSLDLEDYSTVKFRESNMSMSLDLCNTYYTTVNFRGINNAHVPMEYLLFYCQIEGGQQCSCPQTWSTMLLSNSEGLTMSLSLDLCSTYYTTVKFRGINVPVPIQSCRGLCYCQIQRE